MWGFQAAGAAPLVHGRRVDHPETVATAIRIGDPASWELADRRPRREPAARIESVTDDEILAAYRDLARHEGVFCEPASAASVAGLRKMSEARSARPGRHGRRGPDRARPQGPAHRGTPGRRRRSKPPRRSGPSPSRWAGADDGERSLAGGARWAPGHGRGAGHLGQPRGGLRLPRASPSRSRTGSSSRSGAGAAARSSSRSMARAATS